MRWGEWDPHTDLRTKFCTGALVPMSQMEAWRPIWQQNGMIWGSLGFRAWPAHPVVGRSGGRTNSDPTGVHTPHPITCSILYLITCHTPQMVDRRHRMLFQLGFYSRWRLLVPSFSRCLSHWATLYFATATPPATSWTSMFTFSLTQIFPRLCFTMNFVNCSRAFHRCPV